MTTVRDSIRKLGARASTARPAVLEAKPPQGAMPPVVGKGRTPASTSGAGANLVEVSYAARTYWPERTIYSSDGSISMRVRPVKGVVFANGQRLEFKEPA